jgi:hypothetical protein
MNYKEIAPGIYLPETHSPNPIYLSELEKELAELKANIEVEPTNEQLLSWARGFHPYYSEQAHQEMLINEKETFINYLKSL